MIEMLVCGLMAWYHVDCIQFYFYEDPHQFLPPASGMSNGMVSLAYSEKINSKLGIIHFYRPLEMHYRDICGQTVLEHELQRFHQNNWTPNYCNVNGTRVNTI